ncbi:hypothetical protein ACFFHJ_16775 [Planotetraspora thailandica]|uniref:hypothetical protein n=1 Tax=Planotetraspora thailandica TaxID=487172 RepID=UPI0019504247|nr:hypothetical protein [Planotetraspora thailandica]
MQTAVLGSPDSDRGLSLPTERKEAEAYLSRYRGRKFYCGVLIGGCGWRLMDKLYGDRVCHFAHFPDTKGMAPECERRYLGADSADHLFIHRGLSSGLTELPRFEGRLEAGRCIDLLVRRRQTKSAIKVQFVNLSADEWEQQDDVLRAQFGHVDWMLGPTATRTSRYLLERDGYALRVRCEEGKGGARVVKVGTETSDGDLEWSSLDDCEITAKGVVTPLLRKVRASRRPPAERTTPALPGFPLAVKDIIVRPRESTTKAISGPGIPPNSYAVPADVTVVGIVEVTARIMIPDGVDLVAEAPHQLVEPATIDARVLEGQPRPAWTIFSAGLVQIGEPEERAAGLPSVSVGAAELATKPVEGPVSATTSVVRETADGEEVLRGKLNTLIDALRKAYRDDNQQLFMELLEADAELLSTKAVLGPRFWRESGKIDEYRRRLTAGTASPAEVWWTVRNKALDLDKKIQKAKAENDIRAVRGYIGELREILASAPGALDHKYERRVLDDHEAWLNALPVQELPEPLTSSRSPRPDERTADVAATMEDRRRLRSLVDRLQNAQRVGTVEGAQVLLDEAMRILQQLPDERLSYERNRLHMAVEWLAGSSQELVTDEPSRRMELGNLAEDSLVSSKTRAAGRLAERIRYVLTQVARQQVTITWELLSNFRGYGAPTPSEEADLWIHVLILLDKSTITTQPMLSALITTSGGDVNPRFPQVLTGLGFQVPQTAKAFELAWLREVERTHAFYGKPPCLMPPSLLLRKATRDEQPP